MDTTGDAGSGHQAELDELVSRTEGLQPWRRVFHAVNGTLIVALWHFEILTRGLLLMVLGVALVGALTIDVLRFRVPNFQRVFFRSLSALASPREAGGVASSTWYLVGMLIAILAFLPAIAKASILVLALGDPAASYVGRRWGTRRFGDGSIEGTTVFFLVALAVLWGFFPPATATLGAVLATVVERIPWHLDDNLTLPVGTGLALVLLGRILG
jgi:glycerol-3-phosphate acyltransferase PlsY